MAAVMNRPGLPQPTQFSLSRWMADNVVLTLALGASIALHLVLLTIRFVAPEMLEVKARDPGLEVVLVNTRSPNAQKSPKAQFLAQSTLEGGGDRDQGRGSTPLPNVGIEQQGDALAETRRRLEELDAEQRRLLQSMRAQPSLVDPNDQKRKPSDVRNAAASDTTDSTRAMMNQAAIVEARIDAEYKRPKRHIFGSNTNEYVAALYVDNFRTKVERWGNLNYPEAAKGKVYGSVQMQIVIDRNGLIEELKIDKSSGNKVLDEAAMNIVRRAAPYGRFTDQMSREMDLLVLTRTMIFSNDAVENRSN